MHSLLIYNFYLFYKYLFVRITKNKYFKYMRVEKVRKVRKYCTIPFYFSLKFQDKLIIIEFKNFFLVFFIIPPLIISKQIKF